jgi:hypothetical protein
MQSLPDLPQAARRPALERYLANAARNLSANEQTEIARQMLGIVEDSNFAEVFAAGSRPEVPIVGRIARTGGEPVLVSGQVDRLTVSGAPFRNAPPPWTTVNISSATGSNTRPHKVVRRYRRAMVIV